MTLSCPDCCGTGYLSPEEARIVALMAENAALSQQLAEARAELGETRLVLETQENQFGLLQADFNDCNTERARWQGRTAAAEALVAEIREALELALEYWAHKQQRYKNRHPAWVVAAKAALSERYAPQEQVVTEEADDPECTDCGGTGITYQTERRCACQPPLTWRYEIQHGPDGEANFAWVYNPRGEFVCTAKTHHAIAIVDALTRLSTTEAKPVEARDA